METLVIRAWRRLKGKSSTAFCTKCAHMDKTKRICAKGDGSKLNENWDCAQFQQI